MEFGSTQIHWLRSAKENKQHPGLRLGAFFIIRLLPQKLEHFLEHFLERSLDSPRPETGIKPAKCMVLVQM